MQGLSFYGPFLNPGRADIKRSNAYQFNYGIRSETVKHLIVLGLQGFIHGSIRGRKHSDPLIL